MTTSIQFVQSTLLTDHDRVTIDGKTYTTPELRAALKRFPDDPLMEIHPPWCSGGCCNPPAASQPSERHATLRYERGTPGKENAMPRVVSCNWLPDGDYAVCLAVPPTKE